MQIRGYTVKRAIGRGGMATAHLAIQESLQREVVLKTLNSREQDTADFLERFLNEGRIVASLRHPNIITIYDIGHAGDLVYIAMEYVEGGDLKQRIGDRMPPEQALSIVSAVARALDYAHGHGIVHRDVKPANILFRSDGTPLLSDFGIAKQVTLDSELTSTGTILGSPFYMSPEQAEGYVVDGRTDVYSLGVILYEMLVGQRPYQGDTAIKVIMQHIQSPLPKLPRDLADFQPLIDFMMAKDREKRARSAEEVVEEVAGYLEALGAVGTDLASVPAGSEKPGGSTGEFTAASVSGSHRISTGTHRIRRRRRNRRAVVVLAVFVFAALGLGGAYVFEQATKPSPLLRRTPGNTQIDGPGLAPVEAPPPATASAGGVDQRDVVTALEWLAKNSLREDRLTHPPADNAYYYYSRLLALDPGNPAAKQGFLDIAERFVVLAELEFSRKNYAQAQAYVTLGLQVDPTNEGLSSLQSFIDNRERGLFDSVLGIFGKG